MNAYVNRLFLRGKQKFFSMTEPYLENRILEDAIERSDFNIVIAFNLFLVAIFCLFLGRWYLGFLIITAIIEIPFIIFIHAIIRDDINQSSLKMIYSILPVERSKLNHTIWFCLTLVINILDILFLFIFIIPTLLQFGCSNSIVWPCIFYMSVSLLLKNSIDYFYYNAKINNISNNSLIWIIIIIGFNGIDQIVKIEYLPVLTGVICIFWILSLFLTYRTSQKIILVQRNERKAKTISSTICTHRISILDRFLSSPFTIVVLSGFAIIPFTFHYFIIISNFIFMFYLVIIISNFVFIFYFVFLMEYLIRPIRIYVSLPLSKMHIYCGILGSCMFLFLPSFLYDEMQGIDLNPFRFLVNNNLCFYQIYTLSIVGFTALIMQEKDCGNSMIEIILLIAFSIITIPVTMLSILDQWLGMILMLLLIARFAFMIWVTINQSSAIYKKDFMKRG